MVSKSLKNLSRGWGIPGLKSTRKCWCVLALVLVLVLSHLSYLKKNNTGDSFRQTKAGFKPPVPSVLVPVPVPVRVLVLVLVRSCMLQDAWEMFV